MLLEVTTTTGDRAIAERIAAELVDKRLAACVQITGPATSSYHWDGAIEITEEWLCTAKSSDDHWGAIQEVVSRLHPYDVPELIATEIVRVSDAYGAWLRRELASVEG
ncbi:Divalent-cation tolerance protein CutA [Pseudobythopirellula maris]|uniref:Divalent-cation tolerance protein CutA n=1 Tax=Pseudobythopirellula maris TaxID=2527991 RepID=A0A5C5ZN49_9BACT|nr:divalent-cation tolerance protein CutA [Pseudobythopirellula maris]TWT88869.1 Divalent-cation tolerance protein CutA [Pseudobythopirellula maris]